MRVCVYDFVCMSEHWVRLLSAPNPTCTDECCLITMDDVHNLTHTADASDGRTYDAIALHRWLNMQLGSVSFHVIPDCEISLVCLYPEMWLFAGANAVSRRVCSVSDAFLRVVTGMVDSCRCAIANATVRRRAIRRRSKPMMFLEVVNAYKTKSARLQNPRKIVRSTNSAFEPFLT